MSPNLIVAYQAFTSLSLDNFYLIGTKNIASIAFDAVTISNVYTCENYELTSVGNFPVTDKIGFCAHLPILTMCRNKNNLIHRIAYVSIMISSISI